MELFIDQRSSSPIYLQICQQIKAQILNGTLKPDTPLPSIRSLAKDLRISVITTKRAYEELEKDGFLYTVGGKGSFVSAVDQEYVKEECRMQIEAWMNQILTASREAGITEEELSAMWQTLREESDECN
ncbi:MAG: GntR family transcriptional regulator [Solobacterium sp.]|nr:GntR family transcriptional regulator [Solobacterium sp.]